ncbi:MAG: mannitol dehydrogenase family protein [Clostridia bacterium]|nr:mannitol dehydrogenase family protein [Clostridia bacterium]
MRLSLNEIKNKDAWEKQGIKLPCYDVKAVKENTLKNPKWVHFGAGNIFRGFIGSIAQEILNKGLDDTGIIAIETFDFDIIDKIYKPFDSLTLNVMMDKNSNLDMEVLGGVADGVKSNDYETLEKIAKNPSLQMMSYTITEKGYNIKAPNGDLMDIVKADIERGPKNPIHAMSVTTYMLYVRFKNGAMPLAVVSMDNCSHNGEKLQSSVMTIANAWVKEGKAPKEFIDYLNDKVSFPWSMIDKITPRPSDKVKAELESLGIEGMDSVITSKSTYIAPFVNAEIPQYLVVEDVFPNGRPKLEAAGVYMTTREIVNKSETMKVTTCLNPLHTALAVFGCTLGYTTIWEEMKDSDLVKLVNGIAQEGMRVVINPEIINPQEFVKEVIEDRLPNPNIPDAPQRIATDTSQKVGIRYGETIKSYVKSDELDASSLNAIPMAIAGWIRYLIGVDDNGNEFVQSPDPLLLDLKARLDGVVLGKPQSADGKLSKILSDKTIFGSDLYEVGLGNKIEKYIVSMLKGTGAIRETLKTL